VYGIASMMHDSQISAIDDRSLGNGLRIGGNGGLTDHKYQ